VPCSRRLAQRCEMSEALGREAIVLATRSAGKIRELTALCAAEGFAVETLDALGLTEDAREEGIECFESFAENAEAKAAWFSALLPGRLVLAEDSGLVVDALNGAPGVRSKRWSGSAARGLALDAANNAALIAALERMPRTEERRARYVCVALLARDARRWSGEGRVEGTITHAPRGHGGFGYDPFFSSEELSCTFGEASAEEKSRVSHRARALRALFDAARTELTRAARVR